MADDTRHMCKGMIERIGRFDPWPGLMIALVIVISAIIIMLLAIVLWLGFFEGSPGATFHGAGPVHWCSLSI